MGYVRAVVYQDEPKRSLQRFLDDAMPADSELRVLDAGCGYALPVDFGTHVHLIGLDASPEALAKNENIDEGVVGDLESYPFSASEFDAVLCWTVLEHLDAPHVALANMARSLKPSGLLIVGIPNLWSLKALITKLTPHRFHVWVYRRVFGIQEAGTPGHGPYRTYLRLDIAPDNLEKLAHMAGLERVYSATYRPTLGLPTAVRLPWSVAGTAGRVLSLGQWDPEASEHVAVFRKRAENTATL